MMKRTAASGHWDGKNYDSYVPYDVCFEEKLDVGLPDFKFNIILWASDKEQSLQVRIDYRHKPKGSCLLGVGCCWGYYTKM